MYDNGHGPLINAGLAGSSGFGAAMVSGVLHMVLLTATVMFTGFVLWRLVMRTARRVNR